MGEAYFSLKLWDNAIERYARVIEHFPESPRVSTALLKTARCFIEKGDRKKGLLFLDEVIKKFPKSKDADKARELKKTIK